MNPNTYLNPIVPGCNANTQGALEPKRTLDSPELSHYLRAMHIIFNEHIAIFSDLQKK